MREGHRVRWKCVVLLASSAGLLFGAIDGTVVNSTTGKPQPGVTITLVKPGQQGMKTLGTTVSDAAGHFRFENDQPGGGPQLLQASYNDVNYNKLMTPNIPTSNVELDVYEATQAASVARVAERMMLVEPNASQIAVSETVILQNDSKTTYNNESVGSLRFFVPPAANGQVHVNVQGPQGMPLPRAAEKTDETDVFKVNYPVKPGETQFEVTYVIPAGSPFTLRGRVIDIKGMQAGPLRLIAPAGVALAGKDVRSAGTEPKTQATIYTVVAPDAFSVDVSGIGSLHTPETTDPDHSDAPQVVEGQPQIYRHLSWLLAFTLSILTAGLIFLFRSSPVRSPYGK
jgi:Carboxypeptidase regulatory-like domain